MWKTVKLRDVCDFENGDRGKNYPSKSIQTETGVPFINAGHLSEHGQVEFENMNFIPEESYELLGSGKVKNGDILFCLRGSLGKAALVSGIEKAAIASSLVIVRPKVEILNNYYLLYFMKSGLCKTQIQEYKGGTAQPNLSGKSLSLFKILLPPILEQQRIVAKLDAIFDEINKSIDFDKRKQQQIDGIKYQIFDSIFEEEKYSKIKLNDVCLKITDGSHNPPEGITQSDFSMLSAKNVFNDSINYKKPRYLNYKDFESENKRTDVKKDDVLLTIVGTVGRCAVVSSKDIQFTLQRSVAVLKPIKEKILPRFLMYKLQKLALYLNTEARGVAQKGIYLKTLKEILISLPPIEKQLFIVKKIDEVFNRIEILKYILDNKLIQYESLKSSFLKNELT